MSLPDMSVLPVLMVWNEAEYALGIKILDHQHHRMVDMINEAYRLSQEGKIDHLKVSMLFVELHKYVEFHCHLEEELMEKAGYTDLETHKKEHEGFFVNLQRLHSMHLHEIGKGAAVSASATHLLTLLSDWLKDHIQGTDRNYVEALKSAGVV